MVISDAISWEILLIKIKGYEKCVFCFADNFNLNKLKKHQGTGFSVSLILTNMGRVLGHLEKSETLGECQALIKQTSL